VTEASTRLPAGPSCRILRNLILLNWRALPRASRRPTVRVSRKFTIRDVVCYRGVLR